MKCPTKAIERIQVRRLFGMYDYVLCPSAQASAPERLIVLYGDNGSGKTTILRTLFHLLAPEGNEGHKTAVGEVQFQRFGVNLTSGDQIWAERPAGKTTGTFRMGLKVPRKKEVTIEFAQSPDGSFKSTSRKHDVRIKSFLSKLRQVGIGLYFLSDDRAVRLAGRDKELVSMSRREMLDEELLFYHDQPRATARMRRTLSPQERSQRLLLESLKRAEMWIQSQTVRGASEGESSVNTLYAEILKRIATEPVDSPAQASAMKKIKTRCRLLERRSREYAQYGLLPEFSGRAIVKVMKSAPPTHAGIIVNVIMPYMDSVEKKLDAMERIQRQIDAIVSIVNSFFARKRISFDIHKGFQVMTAAGTPLMPQMLSSGERHLLLLFCNTLIALNRPSIFIIDEPEISLNIKWQRRLIDALLECAGKNPVQYVLATHSFELLAQHSKNTIKLAETAEKSNGSKTKA